MGTESVAEMNAQFIASRNSRLDNALTAALTGKLDPPGAPPKGGKAGKPAPKAAASGSAISSANPAPSAKPSAASGAAPAPSAKTPPTGETDPEATGLDGAAEATEDVAEASDEAEAPEVAPELAELQELGKKRDLRGIEKALGLEEGCLGVNNASWKAYRTRVGEVEKREAKISDGEGHLIKTYGPLVGLVQAANKGDLRGFAALIEQTSGVPIAAFIQHYAKNQTTLDPELMQLREENKRLKAGGNLVETEGTAPTVASATAKTDAYITQEAGKHPAFKLSGAKEGVRKLWLESFDKNTQAFRITPQQAAAAFVKERKAAYEREQWILAGKKPPKVATTRALTRRGASETQTRPQNLTRDQLIERGAEEMRRAKRAGALR